MEAVSLTDLLACYPHKLGVPSNCPGLFGALQRSGGVSKGSWR